MFQRWTNPSQPQTLQIAVLLFYADAALNVLFGAVFNPIVFAITVGSVFGGLGIANERKWGYQLALAISVLGLLPVAWFAVTDGITELLDLRVMLALVFPIARLALLVHPQSRDYQRIWFS